MSISISRYAKQKLYSGLTDEATMLDSVNANFTTEPSSNVKVTNQIVETSIIRHQGCDNSSAFDHDSASEVDCEVNVIDSETGMY